MKITRGTLLKVMPNITSNGNTIGDAEYFLTTTFDFRIMSHIDEVS